MKILMMSYAYPPSIGGIERFSALMRGALEASGHEIRVITEVRGSAPEDEAERVQRRPGRAELAEAIDWADLCFVSGVSLHYEIPVLLKRKPMVIAHHGWQFGLDEKIDTIYRLKRFVCRFGLNIAVSQALANDLPVPALAIHNPFQGPVEAGLDFSERSKDVAFLGRLVDQKGVNVLLDAMAKLRARGIDATATILGGGPERDKLERQAAEKLLPGQVEFRGHVEHDEIHKILLGHKMMVVPSLSREGFSMAVPEGLAAGCVVIGSNVGGIPEAIGDCGVTFPEADSDALAGRIEELLTQPELARPFRAAIPARLSALRLDRVCARYLEAFECFYDYRVRRKMSGSKAARLTLADLTRQV
jgi:glycogen(starch) synthase